MSLESLITERNRSPYKERCRVALVTKELSSKDAKALADAIANPTVMATAISAAVRELGHDLTDKSIYRHRKGGCRCGV